MSYKLDGVLTTNDYYGAKPLELIVISPYENPYLAEEGDIVCYSTNVERGSGKLLMVEQNMFVLEKENGETARFNSHSIVSFCSRNIAKKSANSGSENNFLKA